ncbi:MAG: hypothetical protein ACR2JC_17985 [Chloroflexota bacterium]|nr:MAG: hypothetical protein DLM70_12240 [Chloroflexota bacterium]
MTAPSQPYFIVESAEALHDDLRKANGSFGDLQVSPIVNAFRESLHEEISFDLDTAGAFMFAAARLCLNKSQSLLFGGVAEWIAEPEAETSPAGPRDTPLNVAGLTAALWERQGGESFPAADAMSSAPRPAGSRSPALLASVWRDVQVRTSRDTARLAQTAFVRLEGALSGLMRRLRSRSSISFRALIHGSSRSDVVIQFIAVLELVRRRQAAATQLTIFGDIVVESMAEDTDRRARAG